MDNILTLNKINKSDSDIAGYRAVDLADLYNKKLLIPICFVIKTTLFDDFLENHNLRPEIDKIVSETDFSSDESLKEAYDKIRDLFVNKEFSESQANELLESYETLAIDMDHLDIAKLVTAIDKPYLTIIGSPNYIDDSESNESFFQNVKGKNILLRTIKECWASLYTPKALKHRKKIEFEKEEKMAIIVQRMVEAEVSAQVYSDEEEIIVKTFFGYQDYYEEFDKDISVFQKATLTVKNNKKNFQEFEYARDMRDNKLIKKALKEKGESQKLNDKEVEEMARLTKKVEGIIEKPVKMFMNYTKGRIYLLFANRIVRMKQSEEVIEDTPIPTGLEQTEDITHPKTEQVAIEQDLSALDEMESQTQETIPEPIVEPEIVKESVVEAAPPVKEVEQPVVEEVQPEESKADTEPQKNSESIDWSAELSEPEESKSKDSKPQINSEEPKEDIEQIHIGEEPVPAEAIHEKHEPDDFIFSDYEEKTVTKPTTEEVKEESPMEVESEPVVEPKTEPIIETPTSDKDEMNESYEMLNKIVLNSDNSIYTSLKKKHLEVVGKEATSFEEAISGLKESVRIPFIDEIKKVHEIRQKIDQGKKIDIEDSTTSLRTAKNFLNMFS